MNKTKCILPMLALSLAVSLSMAMAETQIVSLEPAWVDSLSGETIELQLIYNVLGEKQKTTGIGLRIHYNSKSISELKPVNMYGEEFVGQHFKPTDDIHDFDNNPLTDKYICIAWMSILGGWPKLLDLPASLGSISVQLNPDNASSETQINITSTSSALGYKFEGQSAVLSIYH